MKRGTTLIEMLIVVAIIASFALIGTISLFGRKNQGELNNATQGMASLLREARSRSTAQTSSTAWGVHFENSTTTVPFYALFSSSTYSTSVIESYYRLPTGVAYVTSSIASGSSTNITFAQLSGLASASTSVSIYLSTNAGMSSTISVASSGAVSY
jgi:prepilin-type N-terminal cleavage/methylation domain-containing protein